MKKWLKRLVLWPGVLIGAGLIVTIVFSPYGNDENLGYKAVSQSVEINAPVEQVFAYMGNSANAEDWSVYVDHISPLNPEEFPDGTVGCKRRCYTQADETGRTWDETILMVEPNVRRRLNIYNLVDFPLSSDFILTEQLYERLSDNTCRLTLTMFLDEGAGIWDQLKMYFSGYKSNTVFRQNLDNIKAEIEKMPG